LAAKDVKSAAPLVEVPHLSAAVLDSRSDALCARLAQRNIPFVLYTGREDIADPCAAAPLILKPASTNEVLTKVEQLLR
jgi:hypothetical protein